MSAFASAQAVDGPNVPTLTEALASQPNISTFWKLVQVGLAHLLLWPTKNPAFFTYTDPKEKIVQSNVTIIVPIDSAFEKLGNGPWFEGKVEMWPYIKYHILPGHVSAGNIVKGDSISAPSELSSTKYTNVTDGQRVILTKMPSGQVVVTSGLSERGTVIVKDVPFNGGLLEVVDSVLRIPERLDVTVASAYPEINVFLDALKATGLISEFNARGNVTIFAPNNQAFQGLLETFGNNLKDAREFKRILRYHMAVENVMQSWEFLNGSTMFSVAVGERPRHLTVTKDANTIYINSARIVTGDILIANGVVHIIDNVLNPGAADARPDPTATTQTPVFYSPAGPPTPTVAGDVVSITSASKAPTNTPSRSVASTGFIGLATAGTTRLLPHRAALLSAIITTLIAAPSFATALPAPADERWTDFVINPVDGTATPTTTAQEPQDDGGDSGSHINSLPFPRNMYAPAARAIPSGLLLGMLFTIIFWAAVCVLRSVTRKSRRRMGGARAAAGGNIRIRSDGV
ncbi:FAS1 domain-containing protein [Lasiosphaeria hispida]|uniref:FAS1 domain-containing protein n=1 Tax=Lasiosphaeria hispida TaxID=260671 RepID=A0AAJ0HC13_9PEZI|nr:FAS1 domain-containing protein [Lasiosphaeria hispida]